MHAICIRCMHLTASEAISWPAKPGMALTETCGVARCEHVTVKFQQRDLETANDWDTLTPGNTAEYAWDEPMAAHRLRVVLESATEAFRDAPVQEYNLDDIKVCKSYTLYKQWLSLASLQASSNCCSIAWPASAGRSTDPLWICSSS